MYNFVNCFTVMNFYSKSERNVTLLKGFIIPYICVEMNEICRLHFCLVLISSL